MSALDSSLGHTSAVEMQRHVYLLVKDATELSIVGMTPTKRTASVLLINIDAKWQERAFRGRSSATDLSIVQTAIEVMNR